jgi:hypothetical protein
MIAAGDDILGNAANCQQAGRFRARLAARSTVSGHTAIVDRSAPFDPDQSRDRKNLQDRTRDDRDNILEECHVQASADRD